MPTPNHPTLDYAQILSGLRVLLREAEARGATEDADALKRTISIFERRRTGQFPLTPR